MSFDQVLDSIDCLPLSQQEEILEIVNKRITERKRENIRSYYDEALSDLKSGNIKPEKTEDFFNRLDSYSGNDE
jgi:hypothetical protein